MARRARDQAERRAALELPLQDVAGSESSTEALNSDLRLVLAWALLCLPNLGGPSLWDIDEGRNAEAAYEMEQSGNALVPTFNYQLRCDKPALLYWLQAAAYRTFGADEFAARLPSSC